MYYKTITEHAQLHRLITRLEGQFHAQHGAHPEFGISGEWSSTPRSGAKWTSAEVAALLGTVAMRRSRLGRKLLIPDLIELAWEHGRTATGLRAKLMSLRKYYTDFEDHTQPTH